jgi:HK97 family phage major capsid protein
LLRRSAISADALVRDRLAYKIAVVAENAFLNGIGTAGQPLGVFTASDLGISTGRDVSTGNTAATPTFDGLKEAKYTMKGQYRGGANWIFHRTIVKLIDKLKDGEGRYIWQASVVPGAPDMILGIPVRESEYAPNTITGSAYVGILGNFANYWIADALTATIQVLIELYAGTNQNGYLSRMEFDGMPVLEEAFVRVKLGA